MLAVIQDSKADEVELVFDERVWGVREVMPHWTTETFLEQDGVFFLKDLVKKLDLDQAKIVRLVKKTTMDGDSPWQVMGIRKMWNQWAVWMKIFAPYYKKHICSPVRSIQPEWDSNVLLSQKGLFLLSEVCTLIPFTSWQIRYQVSRNMQAAKDFGVWKDPETKRYLVNMEVFSAWISKLWREDFK